MSLGKEVGLGPGHIVLDGGRESGEGLLWGLGPHWVPWVPSGDTASHSSASPLSAHAYCEQTVARLSNC